MLRGFHTSIYVADLQKSAEDQCHKRNVVVTFICNKDGNATQAGSASLSSPSDDACGALQGHMYNQPLYQDYDVDIIASLHRAHCGQYQTPCITVHLLHNQWPCSYSCSPPHSCYLHSTLSGNEALGPRRAHQTTPSPSNLRQEKHPTTFAFNDSLGTPVQVRGFHSLFYNSIDILLTLDQIANIQHPFHDVREVFCKSGMHLFAAMASTTAVILSPSQPCLFHWNFETLQAFGDGQAKSNIARPWSDGSCERAPGPQRPETTPWINLQCPQLSVRAARREVHDQAQRDISLYERNLQFNAGNVYISGYFSQNTIIRLSSAA